VRVLVTGATGFIGAALLRTLKRQGHEVIAVVRRGGETIRGVETVVWDLGTDPRPQAGPRNLHAVVHGAQSRRHREFPATAGEMFRVNVTGTWSLLDYAAQTGVAKFCLLSSGTVYEPYQGPLTEEAPLAPKSFLGATKLAAETLARPYAGLLSLCILRLFAPYGPGQQNRLVPDIIERVRTNKPVQLASDGQGPWLTPTFVDDIAEVIAAAVTEDWNETVNVASPGVVSLRQLAEAIGKLTGSLPMYDQTDREPLRIMPSLDRLKARFDMSRFTHIEEALDRMLRNV
jgi:UDP-glucose 4-epimerase